MQTAILPEQFPYTRGRKWLRVFQLRHDKDTPARQALIRSMFEDDGFVASVDYPPSMFVPDLVEMYPGAKFVLTTRESAAVWKASFDATIGVMGGWWWKLAVWPLPSQRLHFRPIAVLWERLCEERYGAGIYARENNARAYEAHNALVRKVVPRERLLEGPEALGWEPLCTFLGVDVPVGVEYPRGNERAKLQRWFREGAVAGCVVWVMWAVGLAMMLWWLYF